MHSKCEFQDGPENFRNQFLLDASVTCLNHGMLGACPADVLERQNELRMRIERQPSVFILRDFAGLLDEARQMLAALISADAEDLVLLPNVTTALSAVLRSCSFLPGDEILTTNHAYLSCTNLLDFVARQTGARVVVAAVPTPVTHADAVIDAVLQHATPRTRLAVLDHVTSPTGLIFPIAALVEQLSVRGIDTLVDGAHAPGMLPLDVQAIGAAYYAGNCHKWLCSPRGAGFLHVRRDRQKGLHPPVISRGYGVTSAGRPRLHLEFDWLGTADPTPLLCVAHAIRFLNRLLPGGLPELMAHNHALVLQGAQRMAQALPLTRLAPDSMVGSMVAFQLSDTPGPTPDDAAASLQRWLYDAHRIDVAVTAWPAARSRVLRVSAQIYNTIDDFIRLGDALQCVIENPQDMGTLARSRT
ncbi:aminotransferase class V-fold PLP-dependent enzyme [Ralstonia pseudosolanacearum]|uniref:aminotransferase class V-fold PLP-dependent enzyme n=1 Tax=Ralstonia pseudosolanacearum TaxID=1310165 RepID=UPI0020030DB7|nr:aminotransferase class V-fold PLP-dependent enzyme [Ralstonia pseudosolanacearum]MCK4130186.1 aminotransferase class V-fold PLP-dependent enzyme [Ralstonia pseudosolanacearum]